MLSFNVRPEVLGACPELRRRGRTCYGLILAALCSFGYAFAQPQYPAKPIRLLIDAPPGGGNDVLGRVIAQRFSERVGQMVVENRGGAGQTISGDIAAKSSPDGYTVLLVSSSFMISALVYNKLPYDTVRDFATITQLATIPQILVADYLAKQGAFVAPGTPAQFQAQVKAEIEKWREVVRVSGMKPD